MANKYEHGFAFEGYAITLARSFGFLYEYEVLAMQVLARSLNPGAKVINFGAGVGTSALAIKEARPDAEIWTIDISEGGPNGGLENERNAFRDSGMDALLPTQILGDSSEVGRTWGTNKQLPGILVDMVFVDGDHSKEGLTADIEAWEPWVKDGGIMVFHDYQSPVWGGIVDVIDNHPLLEREPTLFVVETMIVKRIMRVQHWSLLI